MIYRYAAAAILVLHAAFIAFVVLGVLLVLRRAWIAWMHLPAVVWVALLEFNGWYCPLTPLEVALLRHAGDAGYTGGFVEHYALAAIYPEGLTREIQLVLGAVVVVINLIGYALLWRRWTAGRAVSRSGA